MREQSALTEQSDDNRIGHHAGQNRWNECVGLEAISIQDLDRQQRRPKRGSEHSRDSRCDACDEEDAPLAVADTQDAPHCGAERAANQHRRAFPSPRASSAQRT